ncbi:MAG TPA: hypothetical protein DD733_08325 [Clostridiales bacterium]|nr:hypothetical protein [Clostridiales bacterium]
MPVFKKASIYIIFSKFVTKLRIIPSGKYFSRNINYYLQPIQVNTVDKSEKKYRRLRYVIKFRN